MCGIENDLGGRDKMLSVGQPQDDHGRISRVTDRPLGRRVEAVITTASRRGDERDPPITKVSLPDCGLGRMAADTAAMLMEGGQQTGSSLVLQPVLVPRHSTLDWRAAS